MKKLLSVLLMAMMLPALFTAAHAQDEIKVMLDGVEIEFDVPPQIIDDFTFVPMRAIFEALGASVEWDGTTKTVTSEKNGTVIMMNIGYNLMFVNYEAVKLEAPPQITDERTLVPVRAVAESFDCDVQWDGDTKTVVITSSTENVPEAAPEPEAEEVFPVTYDDANEYGSSLAKNFRIVSVTAAESSKYEVEYTVDTYRESSGDVIVIFDCVDSGGNIVESFSQKFFAYAYCWTPQKASAVISDKTAIIKLADNQ